MKTDSNVIRAYRSKVTPHNRSLFYYYYFLHFIMQF